MTHPSLYRATAWICVVGAMIYSSIAQAAGSGGGGGGGGGSIESTCVNDTYFCSDWSTCSAEGTQHRACEISFDCPKTQDPKPAEVQSCTPPCTADVWACSGWSACGAEGQQTRSCSLSVDCPTAQTPSPAETQTCTPPPSPPSPRAEPRPTPKPTPQRTVPPTPRATPQSPPTASASPAPPYCNDLPSLRERVTCRLRLPEEELERQQTIQYLPEECRAIGDTVARQQCVDLYRRLQACWQFPVGAARIGCVKKIIGLGNVTTAAKTCAQLPANQQADCKNTLKSQIYSLIKFRFYDLEERAEDLREHGVPLAMVANFVAAQEEAKQRFNLATTNAQRRQIILEVRRAWRRFVQQVGPALKKF